MGSNKDFVEQSRSWIDEWELGKTIASALIDLGQKEGAAWRSVAVVKLLTRHQHWYEIPTSVENPAYHVLELLLKDGEVQQFLQVNRYNDIIWFNKEAFEELMWWFFIAAAIGIISAPLRSMSEIMKEIERCSAILRKWEEAEKRSEYQVEKLQALIKE
jgi:hypothetical protein